MLEPKYILVPTDFSTFSDAALERAIQIAGQYNAKIVLLHVIDEAMRQCAVDYCFTPEFIQQMVDQSSAAAKDKLQSEINRITGAKSLDIVFDVQQGNPANVILKEQQSKGFDLIVMASHGKGIFKQLMGSVADQVVKGAKCSVLVVKQ